ncbi:MAG: cysteine desulfurase [Verrucomicrobiae bacterium]|nr:cysteine desulfurase [Verrucomicrobiae bacterium]
MPERTIYFDYNATTPLDPEVRAAMLPFLDEVWGNPSSVHHVGRRARAMLDDFRDRIAALLRCKPGEVVFTSGGTESNALAIFGTARLLRDRGRHLITSAVEHHSVLAPLEYLARHEGFELTVLPVDRDGRVDPADLRRAMRSDTILVSIMAANNEVGTIQPVAELGAICRERGVAFHTDAVHAFGKEPFAEIAQFNADLVSACAHKLHGPKGAGFLFVRSPLKPHPILPGGGQENERRAGTENLAAVAGLVGAFERFVAPPVFKAEQLSPLIALLRQGLAGIDGCVVFAAGAKRLCNTLAFAIEGTDAADVLAALDLEGICASSGAACSAGSLEPSHVIRAMGYNEALSRALIRFSLGRENTAGEVQTTLAVLSALFSSRKRREQSFKNL